MFELDFFFKGHTNPALPKHWDRNIFKRAVLYHGPTEYSESSTPLFIVASHFFLINKKLIPKSY